MRGDGSGDRAFRHRRNVCDVPSHPNNTPGAIHNLGTIHKLLRLHYEKENRPLDHGRPHAPRSVAAFKILVSTILSARTRDETTAAVCERLFRIVRRPADVKKLSVMEIERLIYPVGFYRVKARQLKKLAEVLEQDFGGNIPTTLEGLCRLPGVGRKTANLVLIDAFGKPGICVDTHVHRISNRLGIVQTRTPFETEMRLRHILPHRYWKTWNSLLVFFGQTICRPVSPKCTVCPLTKFCRWVGVESGCSSR